MTVVRTDAGSNSVVDLTDSVVPTFNIRTATHRLICIQLLVRIIIVIIVIVFKTGNKILSLIFRPTVFMQVSDKNKHYYYYYYYCYHYYYSTTTTATTITINWTE